MDKMINEDIFKQYQSSKEGLSEQEALIRLKKYGKNTLIKDEKKNVVKVFLSHLVDPLVYVLLVGFILSLLLKEFTDAFIIIFIVILNGFLSTFQEMKAEKALKSLASLTSPKCLVKRDGKIKEILAEDLTIGDIEILQAGRNVSADLLLIKSSHLLVDESSLTGESLPVEKDAKIITHENTPLGDQKNKAFMSTSIVSGTGQGIVIKTGMNTQIGKIAKMIKTEKKQITPLQKKLNEISNVLAITTVILCILIFIIAIFQKRDTMEMLITAISLAVAVIPEGLLAVVTIVLSLGVLRLSKVNAIVKKLPSVETLGCVNVICSDKTGTLTKNKLTVRNVVVNQQISKELNPCMESSYLLAAMVNCNDATLNNDKYIGDPTEIALLEYAKNYSVNKVARSDCLPFDSNRKMMSTLNGDIQYSKGAIDVLLLSCKYQLINGQIKVLDSKDCNKILSIHDYLSFDGLRVIGLAYKKTNKISEDNLIFIGMVAMMDIPRDEVKSSIEVLSGANIKTLMITGDHRNTALSVARQLNIATRDDEVISGVELDEMDEKQLIENIERYKVFARVSPNNKLQIVSALQSKNNIVAMTGDGVNDAPSLKKANIGIAMGINGTDVAKNASDMILMDDNFKTIEKAVKEGRGIFNNIKKSLLFLLSSNIGEVIVMLIAILLNLPIPLIAIHILWVNLLTDTLPSLALGQDIVDDDVMKEKPRNMNESIFAHKGGLMVIIYGIVIGLLSFMSYIYVPLAHLYKNNVMITINEIFYLLKNNSAILLKAQTFAFSTLALSQLFHSIGIKNINKSIFNKKTLNNPLLIVSLLFGIFIQMLVTMLPFLTNIFKTSLLTIYEFIVILLFSMIPLFVHEIINVFKKN
ncbi:MAG: cation-translocating P-type ATPase [Erysipelotrichaceae bacterium]|nr:cation-translocating P-type ATPase [Erysipelotrichaceae bacterium]